MRTRLEGSRRLVLWYLRRDRILAVSWTALLAVMCFASAAGTTGLYPTLADRVTAARAINASPAVVALYGPIPDVDSLGQLAMTKTTVLYALFVAVLSLVLVRRHTRGEEETGQLELVAGAVVGRNAPIAAALMEAVVVGATLGLVSAAANIAGGLPVGGSLVFGAGWTGIALVGAGLAAVTCQLSASARTCGALTVALLGVLFLVRAIADVTAPWLGWLSPFGWSTRLRAYGQTQSWVLLLYVVAFLACTALAFALRSRRDLGAGLLPSRPGAHNGLPWVSTPTALALRLHLASTITWTVTLAAYGVLLAFLVPQLTDFMGSSSARALIERIGGVGSIEKTLVAAVLSVVGVLATGFALSVVGHAADDEHAGRTAQVLTADPSRTRSFGAVLVVSLGGATWLLLATGLGAAAGLRGSHGFGFWDVVLAALAQAPAVWLVTAIGLACFGAKASWSPVGWVFLVLFITVGQVAELLGLPTWVARLSPFTNAPRMPAETFSVAPELWMALAAGAVLVLAGWRYRARDIG